MHDIDDRGNSSTLEKREEIDGGLLATSLAKTIASSNFGERTLRIRQSGRAGHQGSPLDSVCLRVVAWVHGLLQVCSYTSRHTCNTLRPPLDKYCNLIHYEPGSRRWIIKTGVCFQLMMWLRKVSTGTITFCDLSFSRSVTHQPMSGQRSQSQACPL